MEMVITILDNWGFGPTNDNTIGWVLDPSGIKIPGSRQVIKKIKNVLFSCIRPSLSNIYINIITSYFHTTNEISKQYMY